MRFQESTSMIDIGRVLKICGGSFDLLVELATLFGREGPEQLRRLRDALACGDLDGARFSAHRLRGSVSIFGAEHAGHIAGRVEQYAEQGDLRNARELRLELEVAVAQAMNELNTLSRANAAAVN